MDREHILNELDGILARYREVSGMDNGRPSVRVAGQSVGTLIRKAVSAVAKISGSESDYSLAIAAVAEERERGAGQAGLVFGVVKALRDDIRHGRFAPVADPVYFDAPAFGGFLNVAMQQLSRGDRKAAAVLAGSTLETHLKKMAAKNGLEIDDEEGNPLPVSQVVLELAENGLFESDELQRVDEWLALRKAASAGEAGQLSEERVRTMIAGISAFMVRNPA